MTHHGQGDGQGVPAGGQPWGQPWTAGEALPAEQHGAPGYAQDAYHEDGYGRQGAPYAYEQHASYGGAQPLPAEAPAGSAEATQFLPPTQAAPADAAATQFIPPYPQAGVGGPGSPDNQATQYIAPVPTEEGTRQPPAEFDNLFRADGPVGGAESTQQLPQFDGYGQQQPPAGQAPGAGYGQAGYGQPPQQPGGSWGRGDGGGSRRKQPALLIAGVAGLVVVGLGVGALMSLGGGDDDSTTTTAAASSAAASDAPSAAASKAAADPARGQAEELDKLLADSNNSREAVISAVANIESCKNLGQARSALQDAAEQRRDLVTRLGKLSIDQLPQHDELASALRTGWQASASADDHYAQWAQQAGNKKVCKGGHARNTSAKGQGDTASGQATGAKNQASKLWNTIAQKYDLTRRSSSQL